MAGFTLKRLQQVLKLRSVMQVMSGMDGIDKARPEVKLSQFVTVELRNT